MVEGSDDGQEDGVWGKKEGKGAWGITYSGKFFGRETKGIVKLG